MKKILFICHGNICRSPMAEFVMKDMAAKAGAGERFVIDSAATSTEELGNPVYPPARRELALAHEHRPVPATDLVGVPDDGGRVNREVTGPPPGGEVGHERELGVQVCCRQRVARQVADRRRHDEPDVALKR